jgi:hypothetical protein
MQTYQQLQEVYQALRLYVNCFQPSMKLQAKHYEGRKVRRVYDGAKTPLQRAVLQKLTEEHDGSEVSLLAQLRLPLQTSWR